MAQEGKVLYARYEGVHVLRLLGDIRYPLSPSLSLFIERLFAPGLPAGFVVDLTETSIIDSTILGLIALIGERMRKGGGPPLTIVSNKPDIDDVLTAMGFDAVFRIVQSNEPPPGEAQALSQEKAEPEIMARVVLEAHRTLMAMNERNRELFRDVVAALEQEHAGGPNQG